MFVVKTCLQANDEPLVLKEFEEKSSSKKCVLKSTEEFKNENTCVITKTVATKGFFGIQKKIDSTNNLNTEISIDCDTVKVCICYSGNYKPINNPIEIKPGTINLTYSKKKKSQIEILKTSDFNKYTILFLSRKFYLKLLKKSGWNKHDDFFKNVYHDKTIDYGTLEVRNNFDLQEIVEKLFEENNYNEKNYFYLKTKLTELFLLINIHNNGSENGFDLKKEDLDKLNQAKNYLEENYNNPPSIKELSKIVFLNELKLKTGFKQLHNLTIHNFITKFRMTIASKLINDGLSINEIAAHLGYKSSSHFISAFKKYFGYTPMKYKSKINPTPDK